MDILSVAFVFGVFGSIWGMYYQTDKKVDEWRKELKADFKEYRAETNAILVAIKDEMKDFHDRLFSIESAKKKGKE